MKVLVFTHYKKNLFCMQATVHAIGFAYYRIRDSQMIFSIITHSDQCFLSCSFSIHPASKLQTWVQVLLMSLNYCQRCSHIWHNSALPQICIFDFFQIKYKRIYIAKYFIKVFQKLEGGTYVRETSVLNLFLMRTSNKKTTLYKLAAVWDENLQAPKKKCNVTWQK